MSVTGSKVPLAVVVPKTKIWRLAGVVALIENGANGVLTPIVVVIALVAGDRDGDQAALDDHGAAGQVPRRVLGDVVARAPR